MVASEPDPSRDEASDVDDVRTRIIVAAAALIASGGRDAATTRAVAAAAAVQAPTIYRLFGDKRGLLDAVAEHVLGAYMADKSSRAAHPDPLRDLRDGWDAHIAFGLAHPGLFSIISGDPHPRPVTVAVAMGLEVLRRRVHAIALTGRLRTSEKRAVDLIQAAGVGTVLTLLAQEEGERDEALSETAREAVIAAITSAASETPATAGPRGAAAALRASLSETSVLTDGESLLLKELLDRMANG